MKEDTAKNHDWELAWRHDQGEENEKRLIVLGQSPKRRERLSSGHLYLYGLVASGHKLPVGLRMQGSLQLITLQGA